MKRLINWIRPSFEDNDGKASYRRITAFVFVCLICYMVIWNRIQTEIHLKAFFALLITLLLLIGIVTVQNILTFFHRDKEPSDDGIKSGDQVTIKKEE
ncbi:hypothetical protein FW774_05830 [Pedobacter sp. BS3]|uniref:hypothetical protein n=1 Tax=Pedobacter sp. BS3 TaxID=2567937 RepID=UPI0011EF1150|nr:hypothetical protein [Pedobacter sp. BS3]TZF84506.1 hypothetical protein FW774_05830 [Pedobacter sp. BS3]